MAKTIKTIEVSGKKEAESVIKTLGEKYNLKPTDPENILDISDKNFNVFYDAEDHTVKMVSLNEHHTEEYIKEFLAGFPTFF
jgi:hypothetical protein